MFRCFRMQPNGLALGALADLEVRNCQSAQILNRNIELDLTMIPAIAPSACYRLDFITPIC